MRYNGKLQIQHYGESFVGKPLLDFFITPAQKRHYSNSSICWRQCGCLEANHFHIFWSCSILLPFWQEVYNILQKVFQTDITFEFVSLYLGVLPSENVSSNDKYLFQILSAASRKAITRKWLKLEKPTVDKWFDIIYNIFKMERITFAIRLKQGLFLKRWERWIRYVTPVHPSFV